MSDAYIVDVLDALLARSKAGEVTAIALVALLSDGVTFETISSGTMETARMATAVAQLEKEWRESA